MADVKWTQWSPELGMYRCGRANYDQLMRWMVDLGKDAAKCLREQDKPHAVYGRKIYDDQGEIVEIRFYSNTYLDDDELDERARACGHDLLYVAHK